MGILNVDFYMGEHYGGFRRGMASPLLVDMAIHTFDAARFLTSANALAVYCLEFNPSWSWYRGNASATAIFELSNFTRVEGIPDPTAAVGIAGTLQEFPRALSTGEIPPCECHDNIHSLAMVHAAVESAATGQRVRIGASIP